MFKEKMLPTEQTWSSLRTSNMPLTKKAAQQVTRKRDATNTKHKRSKIF